jgi:hypothetical protein
VRGARAVLEHVVQPTSDTPIAVVWTHRVPFDIDSATTKAASDFGTHGGRVAHFFERDIGLGQMINKSLGWPLETGGEQGAWDIYLFYGKDARWTDTLPVPARYHHQLAHVHDDPGFASGEDLEERLRKATDELLLAAPPK